MTTVIEQQLEVASEDWDVAIKFLDDHLDLSKTKIKDAMNKGAIWLRRGKKRQRLRRAQTRLYVGDRVEVFYNEHILSVLPKELNLVEDAGDYSVWNKPSGMLSQGTDWGDFNSVLRQVELMCHNERSVFLVHRLDREASGLMMVAHHKRMAAELSERFQNSAIKKRYRIEVTGCTPESGEIDAPIDDKRAFTRYERVSYNDHSDTSKLDVWIETGRKHQIRRHFDALGHPVMGDPLYGEGNKNRQGMQLKAVELILQCPIQQKERRFSLYN